MSATRGGTALPIEATNLGTRPVDVAGWTAPTSPFRQIEYSIENNSVSSEEADPFSTEGDLNFDLAVHPLQDLELANWLRPNFPYPTISPSIYPLSIVPDGSERNYL
jgi:hypothetical protein